MRFERDLQAQALVECLGRPGEMLARRFGPVDAAV